MSCCVPWCKKNARRYKELSFFSFPRGQEKEWLRILQFDINTNTSNLRVCSSHFSVNDMYMAGSIRKLRKNVKPLEVETLNEEQSIHEENTDHNECCDDDPLNVMYIPDSIRNLAENVKPLGTETIKEEYSIHEESMGWNENNQDLLKLENEELKKQLEVLNQHNADLTKKFDEFHENYEKILSENEQLKNELQTTKETNEQLRLILKRRNAAASKPILCVEKFHGNESKLAYYTGLQTFHIFYTLLEFVLPNKDLTNLQFFSVNQALKNHVMKLSAENQLFLMLIRLRRGFHFKTLADLFDISCSAAQKIFATWVNLVHCQLGQATFWSPRNQIFENALEDYNDKYKNVIGSIGCIEFFVEQPSLLIQQSQCFSNYKSFTTLKSLIITDPNGCILFQSPLFNGSVSDKQVVIESGLLTVLKNKIDDGEIKSDDVILADKEFNVASLFDNLNIELNIPTYRITDMQFSVEDIQRCRKISHERVHVERAIGRLKIFRILRNRIPVSMLGSIEQIYSLCCLLTNFRSLPKT